MGKSKNPAKAAAQVSAVADFKRRQGGIFTLPSGLTMKLRNPGGMAVFMKQGVIPNSLMPIVDNALKGVRPKDEDIIDPEKGVDDQMVADMMKVMDHVMVTCAVEPQVLPVPESEDDRDDELLYVDELDDTDKMFVFQWVSGGTRDLETFRQRQAANVASLGGSDKVGLPSL